MDGLLADLAHADPERRELAERGLTRLGPAVADRVERVWLGRMSAEVEARLDRVRRAASGPVTPPDQLRVLRGIEVLEGIGTPEARRALADLAAGPSDHLAAREAGRAVARLERPAP